MSEGPWEPTLQEWCEEGIRRFGMDPHDWRFRCPACGNEQTPADFKALGMWPNQAATYSPIACIRRWTDSGCTFINGPVHVIAALGDIRPTLPYADPDNPQPEQP